MAQLSLLPPAQPKYLLDSGCIIRLDGKGRRPPEPPQFTPEERIAVWQGLEGLILEGRLKLISQALAEIERWHPEGLDRLKAIPGHRLTFQRSPDIVSEYQRITAISPNMQLRKSGQDPADPWLIVVAKRHGYTVVSDEASLETRASKRRDLRIPDICKIESIPCLNLKVLANHEGWLNS